MTTPSYETEHHHTCILCGRVALCWAVECINEPDGCAPCDLGDLERAEKERDASNRNA